ncbi:acetyltransferase, GNAT family [Acephala macrosclerotiorum]|nr:acetyltransferase, GNAT family [Acephala macrosclerotiorum]
MKGDIVEGPAALQPDPKVVLTGQDVVLEYLIPEHAPALFETLCGPQNDRLYTWLPGGPFPDLDSFTKHINFLVESPMCFPYTVFLIDPSTKAKNPVGINTLMNVMPSHRTIEIGHVLFGPKLQRTAAATEVNYLLMKYAFEDLHYLRVEWKTNNFNEPSKRAALRLGFKYEGLFRKHMVVRGRGRDTAWYSCLDDEWFLVGKGGVKEGLRRWLRRENFDGEGKQIRKLEALREEA